MPKLAYTPAEAAEQLGISRSAVYDLFKAGKLERIKIGRSARIRHSELIRFLDELGDNSPSSNDHDGDYEQLAS